MQYTSCAFIFIYKSEQKKRTSFPARAQYEGVKVAFLYKRLTKQKWSPFCYTALPCAFLKTRLLVPASVTISAVCFVVLENSEFNMRIPTPFWFVTWMNITIGHSLSSTKYRWNNFKYRLRNNQIILFLVHMFKTFFYTTFVMANVHCLAMRKDNIGTIQWYTNATTSRLQLVRFNPFLSS